MIDLGETRGFEYYTGMVFEVFAERELLGGGGRYDGLMGQFGRPSPATGLALDVERIHGVLSAAKSVPAGFGSEAGQLDLLLCHDNLPNGRSGPWRLPTLARRLRARGRRVATCPVLGRPLRTLLTMARAHHADRLVVSFPGSGRGPAHRLTVVDTRTGVRRVMTAEALLESL